MITAIGFLSSCQDKAWDDHYSYMGSTESELKIGEFIKSDNNLSTFFQMLEDTGFDTILNQNQSYTIWVPTNSAFEGVDLTDEVLVDRLVRNHMSKYLYNTVGDETEKVGMLSGKNVEFVRGTNPSFGGVAIQSSILTKNGIVYVIDDYVPFLGNIFEYLGYTSTVDSMYNYISNQNIKVFDLSRSIEIGVDEETGNVLYDSAFFDINWVFQSYGAINEEDSIYTALLLNNDTWTEAYDSVKKYFVSPLENASLVQQYYTRRTIIKDLFFRGEIENPSDYDSLRTTSGNMIQNPAYLFDGQTAEKVSNGLVYQLDNYNIKPEDSFLKEIKVEAENRTARVDNANCDIITTTTYGASLPISNNRYITVIPTTTSTLSKVNVDFALEGTLAAKYNIYVAFVPTYVADTSDLRPFMAQFYLSYVDADGNTVDLRRNRLTVPNNETKPDSITKLLVAENFEFPYCDLSLDEDPVSTVVLRVENAVSTRQTSNYSREMQIDYILLEPVVE